MTDILKTKDYAPLMSKMGLAFPKAVQDTLDAAKAEAGKHRRTGKFQGSLTSRIVTGAAGKSEAVIGSPLVSAHAHETGAYIRAKRAQRLVIALNGGAVRSPGAVRIPPTPAVTVAGPKFKTFMDKRLQEANR